MGSRKTPQTPTATAAPRQSRHELAFAAAAFALPAGLLNGMGRVEYDRIALRAMIGKDRISETSVL
jgi:hypothetical protein